MPANSRWDLIRGFKGLIITDLYTRKAGEGRRHIETKSLATDRRTDVRFLARTRRFLFATASRRFCGSVAPYSINSGICFSGFTAHGMWSPLLNSCNVEMYNTCTYTSIPPYSFMFWRLITQFQNRVHKISNIYGLMVAMCTVRFNSQSLYGLATECICVFCVDMRTNSALGD